MHDKLAQCKRLVNEVDEDSVDVVIMFSCSGDTFRHQLNDQYKANRKGKRKPVHYKGAVQWCWDNYECRKVDNLEADDLIGIAVTNEKMFRGRKIVVTGDKDLGTIPGEHINLIKIENGLYEVDELEAIQFFYKQALMGDATDGYGGCPGVGPVKAERILEGCVNNEECWDATLKAFKDDVETATLMCRMARILDIHHWDSKKKEAKLWQPPTSK
jgi:DNA polymerase-1